MNVQITLSGCDDSTHIELDVTHEEREFLQRLEDLSIEKGTEYCQPTLHVWDAD